MIYSFIFLMLECIVSVLYKYNLFIIYILVSVYYIYIHMYHSTWSANLYIIYIPGAQASFILQAKVELRKSQGVETERSWDHMTNQVVKGTQCIWLYVLLFLFSFLIEAYKIHPARDCLYIVTLSLNFNTHVLLIVISRR